MRIAVWHNLSSGGAKRLLYSHIKGLIALGHNVESWCPDTADQSYLPLSEIIPEHILPLKGNKTNMPKVFKSFSFYMNLLKGMKALDSHCRECSHFINTGSFDILFVYPCHQYKVPSIARYIERIPKIIYAQEPNRQLYEANPRLQWIAPLERNKEILKKRTSIFSYLRNAGKVHFLGIQAREELINLSAFDEVLANSYFSIESIARSYGLSSTLCYPGIDLKKFKFMKKRRESFLLGIGAFHYSKNIDFIIRSIGRIKRRRPKLIWIGNARDKVYYDSLIELARSMEVEFETKYKISDQEIILLLNRAFLMVYAPILEPFGLSPLEANACGLPVLAIPQGGLRETIIRNKNGFFAEKDENEFGRMIENIIRNKLITGEFRDNCRKLMEEKWTIEASTQRLEMLLKRRSDLRGPGG